MQFVDKFGVEFKCDFKLADCNTLILSGGALKCITFIGALYRIEHILEKIIYYAGTSSGTIVVTLLSIGYTPVEIFKIFYSQKSVPVCDSLNLVLSNLKTLFQIKELDPDITFKELFELNAKYLAFVTTNVSKLNEEILCHVTHPDMPVLVGIKLSCSFPIIFPIAKYKSHIYVDGIFFDNFPIKLSNMFPLKKSVLAITTLNSHYDKRLHKFYKNPTIYKILMIPDNVRKYFNATKDDKFCMFSRGFNFCDESINYCKKNKTNRRHSI